MTFFRRSKQMFSGYMIGHVFETGEEDVNEEEIIDTYGNVRAIETKKICM